VAFFEALGDVTRSTLNVGSKAARESVDDAAHTEASRGVASTDHIARKSPTTNAPLISNAQLGSAPLKRSAAIRRPQRQAQPPPLPPRQAPIRSPEPSPTHSPIDGPTSGIPPASRAARALPIPPSQADVRAAFDRRRSVDEMLTPEQNDGGVGKIQAAPRSDRPLATPPNPQDARTAFNNRSSVDEMLGLPGETAVRGARPLPTPPTSAPVESSFVQKGKYREVAPEDLAAAEQKFGANSDSMKSFLRATPQERTRMLAPPIPERPAGLVKAQQSLDNSPSSGEVAAVKTSDAALNAPPVGYSTSPRYQQPLPPPVPERPPGFDQTNKYF
jgi:hypothetical protein